MSHFDDASRLVQHTKEHFAELEKAYGASLSQEEINPDLLIEIKNFMENLRSALDFTAHGLFRKYGASTAVKTNVYFPYAPFAQSLDEFRKSRSIDVRIPGLSGSRPDIVAKIESYQHFANASNRWLPVFMELNNENKHQQLTPQVRKETKELRISSGSASISMSPGASISMRPGTSIQVGNMIIPGGQTIDVNHPPTTKGPGKKEIIIWVSFHFSTNGEPVLPLLKQSLQGVEQIVTELSTI